MKKENLEQLMTTETAFLIEYEGERGIALKVGENLSQTWKSGDIIVFWTDGEQTVLPDEFSVPVWNNLFSLG